MQVVIGTLPDQPGCWGGLSFAPVMAPGISLLRSAAKSRGRRSHYAATALRQCRSRGMSSPRATHTDSSPQPKTKQVVLVSGGVESSTLLHLTAQQSDGRPILALFMDYGQRAAAEELAASRAQCARCGVGELMEVDVRGVGAAAAARERRGQRRFVPVAHRNLLLLSVATSLAAAEGGVGAVLVALCADDTGWYPSASGGFLDAFRGVVGSLGEPWDVRAPLIGLSKTQVVAAGARAGVEFSATWSCMVGGAAHCGRCVQCKARKRAFAEAGVEEPVGFYRR